MAHKASKVYGVNLDHKEKPDNEASRVTVVKKVILGHKEYKESVVNRGQLGHQAQKEKKAIRLISHHLLSDSIHFQKISTTELTE